jgi:hypothetical protein
MLLSPLRVLGREIIHDKADLVNKKVTFSDLWVSAKDQRLRFAR